MIFNLISLKLLLLVLMALMGIFGIIVMLWFFAVLYVKIRNSESGEM